jgi:hypothetical protein
LQGRTDEDFSKNSHFLLKKVEFKFCNVCDVGDVTATSPTSHAKVFPCAWEGFGVVGILKKALSAEKWQPKKVSGNFLKVANKSVRDPEDSRRNSVSLDPVDGSG